MGRNGAGKTTFAKLMLGLYQDFEGKLLLGNTDIRQLNPTTYENGSSFSHRCIYSKVPSKKILPMANPGASMEQIMEAAKLADLHDFIKANTWVTIRSLVILEAGFQGADPKTRFLQAVFKQSRYHHSRRGKQYA
ncbi:MAG: ATP-binding cassette domain-containing protein [Lewinellaceae bacterium]|nr:ATP-binding cassette domain-containing protein [Lewinellaceae bacterium]